MGPGEQTKIVYHTFADWMCIRLALGVICACTNRSVKSKYVSCMEEVFFVEGYFHDGLVSTIDVFVDSSKVDRFRYSEIIVSGHTLFIFEYIGCVIYAAIANSLCARRQKKQPQKKKKRKRKEGAACVIEYEKSIERGACANKQKRQYHIIISRSQTPHARALACNSPWSASIQKIPNRGRLLAAPIVNTDWCQPGSTDLKSFRV